MNLCIKWNNTSCRDECAICGGPIDPPIGLQVFACGSGSIVCDACAQREAPELLSLLRLYDAAQAVAFASTRGQANDPAAAQVAW